LIHLLLSPKVLGILNTPLLGSHPDSGIRVRPYNRALWSEDVHIWTMNVREAAKAEKATERSDSALNAV